MSVCSDHCISRLILRTTQGERSYIRGERSRREISQPLPPWRVTLPFKLSLWVKDFRPDVLWAGSTSPIMATFRGGYKEGNGGTKYATQLLLLKVLRKAGMSYIQILSAPSKACTSACCPFCFSWFWIRIILHGSIFSKILEFPILICLLLFRSHFFGDIYKIGWVYLRNNGD